MKNLRSYYTSNIEEFMNKSVLEILREIKDNSILYGVTDNQEEAWKEEIEILKYQLKDFSNCRIMFEYTIPRMGKRVDVILLYKNIVFVLEFKCGDKIYKESTYNQVYDYSQDLRNFHKESYDKLIVPIMISTKAEDVTENIIDSDRIVEPLKCNAYNIADKINLIADRYKEKEFDYSLWENSEYLPTPTIIEAAQALYRGHKVEDITRNDAKTENISKTKEEINKIIDYSKKNRKKSICFVTGVPGAGKTLVGLDIAIQRENAQKRRICSLYFWKLSFSNCITRSFGKR